MIKLQRALCVFLFIASAHTLWGQACYMDAPPVLSTTIRAQAMEIAANPATRDGSEHYNELILYTFAHAVASDAAVGKLRGVEFAAATAQTDKQVSSGALSSGSTSLLEKPNFSNLLGFAIEHGAVTKTIDGTTLKLSTSPYAFVAAANGDTSTTYHDYEFFTRLGLAANFRINDQNNVLASATRKQLAQWSARFRLTQDHSARSSDFQNFWNNNIKARLEAVPVVLTTQLNQLFNGNPPLEQLRRSQETAYLQAIKNEVAKGSPSATQIERVISCFLEPIKDQIRKGIIVLSEGERQRFTQQFIPDLQQAQLTAAEGRKEAEDYIAALQQRGEATFAYTNYRVENGSDYSDLQMLFERKAFLPMKIVANAGVSIYNKPNVALNQQRARQYSVALSFEGKGGRSPFLTNVLDKSPITYAFSGRYDRMPENRHRADRKADIAQAQFRLEIPIQTGLSIPLSITYANATDLIKEHQVRGNFGFTLDTDKLMALARMLGATK